jgi:hypothetical protein
MVGEPRARANVRGSAARAAVRASASSPLRRRTVTPLGGGRTKAIAGRCQPTTRPGRREKSAVGAAGLAFTR